MSTFLPSATYANKTAPYFVPNGAAQDMTVRNLTVTGDETVAGAITAAGGISGNVVEAVTVLSQGSVSGAATSYTNIQTDGSGNAEILAVTKATAADGKAYLALTTEKPAGGANTLKAQVNEDGGAVIQRESGAGLGQQIAMDVSGLTFDFNLGAQNAATIGGVGIRAGSFQSTGAQVSLGSNTTTTLTTFNIADYVTGRPFTVVLTALWFSGDLSFGDVTTVEMTISKFNGSGTGMVMIGRIANTPSGLPTPGPGENWTVQLTGSGTATMTLSVTTSATPIGPGGEFAQWGMTVLGAQ